MKKILFLTDNFPPETNAPATRTFEHAKIWVSRGCSVTVITCFPNFPTGKIYDGYKNSLFKNEIIEGIRVIRVWSYITPNSGVFKRTLDYISFGISSFIASFFVRFDIIIGTSPQFFTAVSTYMISKFRFSPWIMEVRDIWPESIRAVGAIKDGLLYKFLEKIEIILYKSATKIIVVTDSFKKNITAKGIDSNKIYIHKNGIINDNLQKRKITRSLKKIHKIEDKIIFAYIGTHGMAHKLDFILLNIKSVQKIIPKAFFLFIGDGSEKKKLTKIIKSNSIQNILFLDGMSKEEVYDYISIIDISIINLKKSLTFKSVIPSKIFEAAAMKKPILLGLDGEAKKIIKKYNSGICFEPENSSEFIKACKEIIKPQTYAKLQKGCEKLAVDFDRKKIAIEMLKTINK